MKAIILWTCFRCILQTVWKEIYSYFDNHSLQRVLTECKHFQHFPGIGMLQFCTIWRFFFPHKYLFFYTWRGCEGERSATWGQCSSGVCIFVRVNSVIWSRNRPKSDILEGGGEENSLSFLHFDMTHSPLSETIDCYLPFVAFLQLWQFAGLKLAASF